MLTKNLLHSLVTYNPDTGILEHRTPYRKSTKSSKGYLWKRVLGKKYLVHQLAFLYMTGEIPKLIDHIDGNIQNNSWNNLREATKSLNALNSKKCIGVYPSGNKWLAKCMVKGKLNYLGVFNSFEDARQAYENFKKDYI